MSAKHMATYDILGKSCRIPAEFMQMLLTVNGPFCATVHLTGPRSARPPSSAGWRSQVVGRLRTLAALATLESCLGFLRFSGGHVGDRLGVLLTILAKNPDA
jgi:hypothetical protein